MQSCACLFSIPTEFNGIFFQGSLGKIVAKALSHKRTSTAVKENIFGSHVQCNQRGTHTTTSKMSNVNKECFPGHGSVIRTG